ncbi:AraC family transcriptional regulator [Shewanella sp. TC10]|uniref:AraC family transcriptional regulator n=1 Tax=Shewanella sp. TC10 TaxID=1419739 RepID=UPI001E49AEDC|nr:AraC family transcriptional regulator [Shewanella sp. TC10]
MNQVEQGFLHQNIMIKSVFSKPFMSGLLAAIALCIAVINPSYANDENAAKVENNIANSAVASELEDIKSQVIKLNRDLFILEEDLLFPASTQVAVFVSVDIGRFFTLDSVELKINSENVAGFLYTQRQRRALEKGGIQKVYMGNLKTGQHQLTAIFTGVDAEGRPVQRAVNHEFEKTDETVMLELKLEDNASSYRADVKVEEWVL